MQLGSLPTPPPPPSFRDQKQQQPQRRRRRLTNTDQIVSVGQLRIIGGS